MLTLQNIQSLAFSKKTPRVRFRDCASRFLMCWRLRCVDVVALSECIDIQQWISDSFCDIDSSSHILIFKTQSLSNDVAVIATCTVHTSNQGRECPPDPFLTCPIVSIGSSISLISKVSSDVIQVCFLGELLLSEKSHPISRSGSVGHEMSYQWHIAWWACNAFITGLLLDAT